MTTIIPDYSTADDGVFVTITSDELGLASTSEETTSIMGFLSTLENTRNINDVASTKENTSVAITVDVFSGTTRKLHRVYTTNAFDVVHQTGDLEEIKSRPSNLNERTIESQYSILFTTSGTVASTTRLWPRAIFIALISGSTILFTITTIIVLVQVRSRPSSYQTIT
jgi:alpha-amylase/alpha-mannosidase (GH57 family)